jgi:hypothetical protein
MAGSIPEEQFIANPNRRTSAHAQRSKCGALSFRASCQNRFPKWSRPGNGVFPRKSGTVGGFAPAVRRFDSFAAASSKERYELATKGSGAALRAATEGKLAVLRMLTIVAMSKWICRKLHPVSTPPVRSVDGIDTFPEYVEISQLFRCFAETGRYRQHVKR